MMRGIILAAGRGSRMGDLTAEHPKALLHLHDKPLIEWQVDALQKAGVPEIGVVTGYKADTLNDYPLHFFINPRWHQTNMLSTLLCASEWLEEDTCIISYSDIVYHAEAVRQLVNAPGELVITYDPDWQSLWQKRFDDPLSDAESFLHQAGILVDIGGKTTRMNDIQGQYMGLIKMTQNGWKEVKNVLSELDQPVIDSMDMTALLKFMLKRQHQIHVVSINTPWCEIDSAHDYKICAEIIR